jgi:hypothetical protein
MDTKAESVIQPFAEHLSWVGFTIEWREGKVRPYAVLKHASLPNMILDQFAGVVKLFCLYGTSEAATSQKENFLGVLNDLNREAGAAKFYTDKDGDLNIESVFPASYSKTEFGAYWLVLEQDVRRALGGKLGEFLT